MPTIEKQTLEALRRVYRMHEYEPGFQLAEGHDFGDLENALAEIIRAARIMDRNAVNRCNGIERWDAKARMRLAEWTDADEAKAERSDEKAEARVKAALAVIYGATWADRIDLETCGDPRGPMVKLWAKGFRDQGWPRLSF